MPKIMGRSESPSSSSHVTGGEATAKEEREESVTLKYPLLTSSNYPAWSIKMKVFMQAQGVWDTVEAEGRVDDRRDKMALAAIYQGVNEEILLLIAEKTTAKDAWAALKSMYVGADRVTRAKLQTLKTEFEALRMREGESVDDFAMRLTTVVSKMRAMGEKMDDIAVVEKVLRAVTPKFLQIASTLEQFGDLKEMTAEEVFGRLKAHEERLRGFGDTEDEHMLLIRPEWEAKTKKKGGEGFGSGWKERDGGGDHGRGGGRGRGRGRGRGCGDEEHSNDSGKKYYKFDKAKVRCYNCQNHGHYASECRKPKKEERAHFVEKQYDDEPALLLNEVCESPYTTQEEVMLHEENVKPRLSSEEVVFETGIWYLDTGASNHMTGCRKKFSDLDEKVCGRVKFGDGSVVEIQGRGTVMLQCQNGEHRLLTNVYFIPKLCSNIMSLGQMDENGCKIVMEGGYLRIYDRSNKLLANVRKSKNMLYVLNLRVAHPVCLLGSLGDDAWRWHARYGHLNFPALRKLAQKEMVIGMPAVEHVTQICDGCIIGKHHRTPFPHSTSFRADKLLGLVHGDLCGPITPATPAGNKYFMLLVDDHSRYMWVVMLKSKSEAFGAFKKFKASVEVEAENKLKAFRTDRGGEFTSNEFTSYCEELGIKRYLTAPYSPQQNGVVERRNQTVLGMARSLLKSKHVPAVYWGEAVRTAVYLLNRAPTRSLEGMTPYQVWTGRKPNVQHLRVFGCVAHVKTVSPHLKKLSDRSVPMVFFGYEPGSKAYRVYDPDQKKLHVSRDIIFDEDKEWNWESSTAQSHKMFNSNEVFTVHYEPVQAEAEQEPRTPASLVSSGIGGTLGSDDETTALANTPKADNNTVAQEGTPDSSTSSERPLRYRSLQEIYDETREVEGEAALCFLSVEEPATFEEAKDSDCWKKALYRLRQASPRQA